MLLQPSSVNEKYVDALVDLFSSCPIDKTVSYKDMRKSLGFDPREQRYLISKALKIANQDHGVVTKTLNGIGYQRISDGISVGTKSLSRVRRVARRGGAMVKNWMSFANLDDTDMRRGYAMVTQLGIVEYASSKKAAPDLSRVDLAVYRPVSTAKDTLAEMLAIRASTKKLPKAPQD